MRARKTASTRPEENHLTQLLDESERAAYSAVTLATGRTPGQVVKGARHLRVGSSRNLTGPQSQASKAPILASPPTAAEGSRSRSRGPSPFVNARTKSRLGVVPKKVVHPGLPGGWWLSMPPAPEEDPDEASR